MSRLVGNLYRGFGPTSGGGGSPPDSPTITITDNRNGSGAIAEVAGDGGVTNKLYTLPYGGSPSLVGSRSGNGAIPFSTSVTGRYWGWVIASNAFGQSISNLVSFTVSIDGSTGQPPSGLERVDSPLDTILTLFVERITSQVDGFNAENCFLTLHPDLPPPPVTADVFVTVAPMSGRFDLELMDGGGATQATVETAATVRVYSTCQLDEANHATIALTDMTHGMIGTLTKILTALTAEDLDDGIEAVLREPVKPLEVHFGLNTERELAYAELQFRLYFDWLLT